MTEHSASKLRILARGATKRCPRCGSGGLFHRWFTMVPDCPRCGLHFEREAGYWTGAVAMNTILVGGLFTIVLVISLVLTVPEVPWVAILAIVVPIMVFGPIVAYPFSKTLWCAVDLALLQALDRF